VHKSICSKLHLRRTESRPCSCIAVRHFVGPIRTVSFCLVLVTGHRTFIYFDDAAAHWCVPTLLALSIVTVFLKQLHVGIAWLQASAAMQMRSALFWGITQCRVLIVYRCFGTTYRSNLQGSRNSCWTSWLLKMGPISCPEMSLNNYHSPLRNIPGERRCLGNWLYLRLS
jgi:hypothetical protein